MVTFYPCVKLLMEPVFWFSHVAQTETRASLGTHRLGHE